MKKIKKYRFLALVLMLTMIVASLSGCEKQEEEKTSTENVTEVVNEKDETKTGTEEDEVLTELSLPLCEEKETLSLWVNWTSSYMESPNEIPAVQKMEEITNVHIDYTVASDSEATEKYGLMLASGDYPDMMYHNIASMYPGGLEKGVEDGVLIELTEYIDKYMPNYKAYCDSDPAIGRAVTTDSGKKIGAYTLASVDSGLRAEKTWCGMVVRQDWLDQLDMDVPVTIDDWTEMLRAFKNDIGCTYPLTLGPGGYVYSQTFLTAYGVTNGFYLDGDTIKYGPAQDGYRQYLELLQGWYEEGLIEPNFLSGGAVSVMITDTGLIVNDTVGAFVTINSYVGRNMESNGFDVSDEFYLTAVPSPVLNEGDAPVEYSVRNDLVFGPHTVITTNCENVELACKWIDYQYTNDGMLLNNMGLEDESYVVNAPGDYDYTDYVLKNDEFSGYDMRGMTSYAGYRGSCPGIYNWEPHYDLFTEDVLAETDKWEVDGIGMIIPSTVSMTDEEGAAYNAKYADIQTLVQEYTVNAITGVQSLDDFDSFIQKLYDYGLEECLGYRQAAYDRYLSR